MKKTKKLKDDKKKSKEQSSLHRITNKKSGSQVTRQVFINMADLIK